MRILFDALAEDATESGARTRLFGLLPPLLRDGRHHLAVLAGPNLARELHGLGDRLTTIVEPTPPATPFARSLRNRSIHARARKTFAADLVVAEAWPWPRGAAILGLVHDLRHFRRRGIPGRLARRVIAGDVRRAARIHVPSEVVRSELEAVIPDAPAIDVVPNGVDADRFTAVPGPDDDAILAARGLAKRGYLLVLGHLVARKNPLTALLAAALLVKRGLHYPVVFVGRGPLLLEEPLSALRAELGVPRLGMVLRDVTNAELPALLRHAAMLLAPARDEGFGLAPLEALACGTPVVASSIPAHLEILGDAPLFVPPHDPRGFADAAARLLLDGSLAARGKDLGPALAKGFGWDVAAKAFLASLSSLGDVQTQDEVNRKAR